ncbi:MAG: hypothetical protein M1821_004370 [Bathelium mastoideum]|nr:MAG: hypothetical protein M1821_004370 [Bathelium mastoideum]
MSNEDLRTAIKDHLNSKSLKPSASWLDHFLAHTRPNTPLPALKQTALFRLLASDLTITLDPDPASALLPPNVHDASIRERRLTGTAIPVQVLEVEDLSRSRWAQVEAIEAAERGETTKGREVVRVVPGEEGLSGEEGNGGKGQHKVLMQDARGTRVYGFELEPVAEIGVGMNIGAKLVLREALVARGMVLMEPRTVTVLGGKVEGLHKRWREGRKQALKEAVGIEDGR